MQTMQPRRELAAERARSEAPPCAGRRGSVLVEFALVSLAFYLILAGTLEVGRMITSAQIVQNAARVAARELALLPLPATMSFQDALRCDRVRERVYDPRKLAVPLPSGVLPDTSDWPTVNRILLPLMVVGEVNGTQYLHYPGALVQTFVGNEVVVKVPQVVARGADGVESIRWVDVLEEVVPTGTDPGRGPFSLASTGPERGLVAIRVHYPYQAATLTAFQPVDVTDPNPVAEPILADDAGVTQVNAAGGVLLGGSGSDAGPYSGQYGLGKFYALNREVRPFRRLISSQAVFRREVFHAGTSCP
ncbi:MAG: pilus assembly protein [Planctomycetes bacterium]|nr:pilus assembly protein [Planctomycetota bacterium]